MGDKRDSIKEMQKKLGLDAKLAAGKPGSASPRSPSPPKAAAHVESSSTQLISKAEYDACVKIISDTAFDDLKTALAGHKWVLEQLDALTKDAQDQANLKGKNIKPIVKSKLLGVLEKGLHGEAPIVKTSTSPSGKAAQRSPDKKVGFVATGDDAAKLKAALAKRASLAEAKAPGKPPVPPRPPAGAGRGMTKG